MKEKLPYNSRYRNIGERKTKERNRLPNNILQSFIFPGSQGSVSSIFPADQMSEQGCRYQDNEQLLTRTSYLGHGHLLSQDDYDFP